MTTKKAKIGESYPAKTVIRDENWQLLEAKKNVPPLTAMPKVGSFWKLYEPPASLPDLDEIKKDTMAFLSGQAGLVGMFLKTLIADTKKQLAELEELHTAKEKAAKVHKDKLTSNINDFIKTLTEMAETGHVTTTVTSTIQQPEIIPYAVSIIIDFNKSSMQRLYLTGDVVISLPNAVIAGKNILLDIEADNNPRLVTLPDSNTKQDHQFTLAAGTRAQVAFSAFTDSPAYVVIRYDN